MSHTPGPWTVQGPFKGLPSRYLVTSEDGVVCDVGLNVGPQPANASLIAAAPDLLAVANWALARLVSVEDLSKVDSEAMQLQVALRNAIAKAEGR